MTSMNGITFYNTTPTLGRDVGSTRSLGRANFQPDHLVGEPNVAAMTSPKTGRDFIQEFGNQTAKDAAQAIEDDPTLTREQKDEALKDLANDVKTGHLMKGIFPGPNQPPADGFGTYVHEKAPQSRTTYNGAIAARIPANSTVPLPDFENMDPTKRGEAYTNYLNDLEDAGVISKEQRIGLENMFHFTSAVFYGGDRNKAAADIAKSIQQSAIPPGANVNSAGTEMTWREGPYIMTAKTVDGEKQLTIENVETGETTVLKGEQLKDNIRLANGGEIRPQLDAQGNVTGLAINGDGKPGNDQKVSWDKNGKFGQPTAISDWSKLPLPPGVRTLVEQAERQSDPNKAWKTEGGDAATPPAGTDRPASGQPQRSEDFGNGLFGIDLDPSRPGFEAIGIDNDGNGRPDQIFTLPSTSSSAGSTSGSPSGGGGNRGTGAGTSTGSGR